MRACLIALLFFSSSALAEGPTVAFLEDEQKRISQRFRFAEQWEPVEQEEEVPSSTWFAVIDGQLLGQIAQDKGKLSFQWKNATAARVNRLTAEPWGETFDGKRTHRPLVLLSKKQWGDPDRWKPSSRQKLPAPIRQKIETEYLKKTPSVECPDAIAFKAKDIEWGKIYASKKGEFVVPVVARLPPKCDGILDVNAATYLVSSNGEWVDLLSEPSNGIAELKLIDSGDFDGDGHSELVFSLNDYDWDGYLLVDGKTHAVVKAGQGYH